MSEFEEGSKAVQEASKTAGKAIDAGREAGTFLARYVGQPLEHLSGIVSDHLMYVRWERVVRLRERSDKFLRDRGIETPTRSVPPRLAIPIIREGILEEDDELQDRWAILLVNAADAKTTIEIRHAFVSILKDMTPFDALLLTTIYSISEEEGKLGIRTEGLPEEILPKDKVRGRETREDVRLSMSNLLRLNLIGPPTVLGGGEALYVVYQTTLGREFMKACTPSKHGCDQNN